MSFFDRLSSIKNDFQDNVKDKPEHSLSGGLLQNFAKTFVEHKGLLLALSAVSLMGSVKGISMNAVPQEPVSYESNISQYQNYKSGLEVSKKFINSNYKEDLKKLDYDAIQDIMGDHKMDMQYVFKNPYTDKNIISLKILQKTDIGSYASVEHGIPAKLTLHNSLLVMDHDSHNVVIVPSQLKDIKEKLNLKSSQSIIDAYVINHEMAHTTVRQSPRYDGYTVEKDKEAHSDISSIILTTKEASAKEASLHSSADVFALSMISKNVSLETFNTLVDDVIVFRTSALNLDGKLADGFDHNSVYSLLELKNAVNKNPELLTMRNNNITEFSHNLLSNISEKNYTNMMQSNLEKRGIEFSKESVLQELKSGSPSATIKNAFAHIVEVQSDKTMPDYIKNTPDARLQKVANKIAYEINNPRTYNDMIETLFLSSNKEFHSDVVNDLYKQVQEKSNLDESFIKVAKQEIYFDSLNFASNEDGRTLEITQSANNYMKHNI